MNQHDATETSYKNGYKKGVADAMCSISEKEKKGTWIFNEERDSFLCSECGGPALLELVGSDYVVDALSDYCPHCGKKMDGEGGQK